MTALPRRILIHGVTGSGKSTAAVAIAAKLDYPVVLADDIGWLPGWVERPLDEQQAMVIAAAAGDTWVFDSTYTKWRDVMIDRVELVVGLDYPRWLSLGRLLRRTAHRIRTREAVCNGNYETLSTALSRDSIIAWHFRSWKRKRAVMHALADDADAPPTLLFRHPRELRRWIDALAPGRCAAASASLD